MLFNFSFKNFKSYADLCDFTMLANSDKTYDDKLFSNGKDKVSRVKIIYGANASGKTSFMNAIDFVKIFAMMSNTLVENTRIGITPFKFRDNFSQTPSEFSITFVKNNLKYNYCFSCNFEKVINEKLDIYYSAKPTNIFTRSNTVDYKFNTDTKILNEIKTKNTKNKLFLITAATWNYEKVKPVVDYILSDLVVLYDPNEVTKYNLNYLSQNGDLEDYKNFCLKFLNNADFSISDFEINTKKLKEFGKQVELMSNIFTILSNDKDPDNIRKLENTDVYNIVTTHNIKNNNKNDLYRLQLIEESMGTQEMFYLAPVLYYVFKEGKTLFLDEIDRSLHPLLVEYIIKMFYDSEINKNNAQLICNTHDTNLLNLDLFRRDEIWFTERNNETGTTEMYALSDFSPRKNENIERAYLLGRFGAIPFIKEG